MNYVHTEAIGRSERTGVLSKEVMLGKLDANPEKGDCGGLFKITTSQRQLNFK